jgi:hypothetical protein
MSVRYYVYAIVSPRPILSVSTHNPPVTGGVVIGEFDSDETDLRKLHELAQHHAPPLRIEASKGQSWTLCESFAENESNLDEALMMASAFARVDGSVRLIAGDTVLRTWRSAA